MAAQKARLAAICGWVIFTLASIPLHAQFLGHTFKGDFGLQSGSQPTPGW